MAAVVVASSILEFSDAVDNAMLVSDVSTVVLVITTVVGCKMLSVVVGEYVLELVL